ncbi:hypothetical protein MRS44_013634 [Fusarium solani]|uniref:uncharacterized protein n=1 Tax=Fusarium solani TaxID=169388 RepID=UPI0032C3F3F2|nr:hypothetical protein MRS44_013634 [Fusarium solani]
MKRSLSESRRSAWQQPASCEFCRSKKIRCDKERPCSNCTTRQLECRYVSEDANPITESEREDYGAGYLSLRRIRSNPPSRTRSEAIDLARAKLRWANRCEFYGSQQLDRRSAPPLHRELKDAHELHPVWKRIALESVMSHDAAASLTLTSLQSISIMMYLTWDSEGQSTTFHTLRSLAHTKAVQMKLHRLDADTATDVVQAELKRRLWWHLAATDWLIASVPGPREGIYSFHTKHILPSGEASLPYDQVLRMSSRYTDFMDRLPWFFCADEKSSAQAAVLASRRPYLLRQKFVLLYGIYSRIGRLHRPFLLRGTDEKEFFSVSHSLAIQCAERMIEIRRMVEPGDLCLHVHSHSMDQHSFSALLLLSMGILGEKDTELAQKRKADLLPICSMLKEKQGSLSRAGHGISAAIDRLVETLERPNLAHDWPGAHLDGPSIQDVATLWEELIKELPSPSDIPWDDFLDWQGP